MSIARARPNSRAASPLAAVLLLATSAAAAPARTTETLAVRASGCGETLLEVRELQGRLATELAPAQVGDPNADAVLQVETTCDRVRALTLRRAGGARTRAVDLSDVEPRLRGVALAVLAAEFVRSAGIAVQVEPPPPAPASDAPDPGTPANDAPPDPPPPTPAATPAGNGHPPPPAEAARATRAPTRAGADGARPSAPRAPERDGAPATNDRRDAFEVGASGAVRRFIQPLATLTGGSVDGDTRWGFAHAGAAFGGHDDTLGHIVLSLVSLSAGPRYALVLTPTWELDVLAGAEAGWARASAEAADATVEASADDNAVFAAAFAGGEVVARVVGDIGVGLSMRAGWARGLLVTADDREIAGTSGLMIGIELGLRYGVRP